MKLGTLTAILGEHHLAYRDNLCPVPHDEHEREEKEGEAQAVAATASGPADWPE